MNLKTILLTKPKGVLIFSLLYFLFAVLMFPNLARAVMAFLYSLINLVRPFNEPSPEITPGGLVALTAVNLASNTIAPILFVAIGIGLLRSSNSARVFMLVVNACLSFFIAVFIFSLNQSYKAINASLFFKTAVWLLEGTLISAMIYFSLPAVRRVFK